jgi:hypothetical protein
MCDSGGDFTHCSLTAIDLFTEGVNTTFVDTSALSVLYLFGSGNTTVSAFDTEVFNTFGILFDGFNSVSAIFNSVTYAVLLSVLVSNVTVGTAFGPLAPCFSIALFFFTDFAAWFREPDFVTVSPVLIGSALSFSADQSFTSWSRW